MPKNDDKTTGDRSGGRKDHSENLLTDELDRRIMNHCQEGMPLTSRPFARWAEELGIEEEKLIERAKRLKESNAISRFGPVINYRACGGESTLVAASVPEDNFEKIASFINGFPQVSHNYRRDHDLNMWFVISAESDEEISDILTEIREETGLELYNMPTLEEYFIGVKLSF